MAAGRHALSANGKEKINLLAASKFSIGDLRWHKSRDTLCMLILIVLFPIIGSLLCVLVFADHQASEAVDAVRVRKIDLS